MSFLPQSLDSSADVTVGVEGGRRGEPGFLPDARACCLPRCRQACNLARLTQPPLFFLRWHMNIDHLDYQRGVCVSVCVCSAWQSSQSLDR